MHVGDLLHAQPAELAGAHGAVHAVAAAVVGLHDVSAAARARLDLLRIYGNRQGRRGVGGETCVFTLWPNTSVIPCSFWLTCYVCSGLFILCISVTTIILHPLFK